MSYERKLQFYSNEVELDICLIVGTSNLYPPGMSTSSASESTGEEMPQ